MTTEKINVRTAKVAVVLNTASGSCDESAEEVVRSLLAAAGCPSPRIWSSGADLIENAFTEAREYAPDILIVLGGDGTIRAGAELCKDQGPYLIPLPGGTMNMLPKALYGARTWQKALEDTLSQPRTMKVSGGEVGRKRFFITAIIGAPTLWTEAREALRAGNLGAVIEKGTHAFQHMLATKVRYSFSKTTEGEADAVSVICPLLSDVLDSTEQSFDAAAITVNDAVGVLALASSAAFGAWRDDARVKTVKTRAVRISAEEPIPLILDGEVMELGNELAITFVPQAFRALVPAS